MRNVIVAVFVKSKPTLFQIDVTVQRVIAVEHIAGHVCRKKKKERVVQFLVFARSVLRT